MSDRARVAIVGGGPAGLAAARELARRGVRDVVVFEREAAAGGIPRHARHQGFGLRDLRRPLSGPAYAGRLRELARAGGAELVTATMVTGWAPAGPLELTGPAGRSTLEADAVILATGCRERPRSARLVPGSRPDGVMTTGTLQQLVYLKGCRLGGRALVVGAEHVSFSALMTLDHGGARTVGMTTELRNHQTFAAFRAGARVRYRAPLWTRTAVSAIHGRRRVEEVVLTGLDTGRVRSVACWRSWGGSSSTRVRAARRSIARCARREPVCSLRATSCTGPRPLTWPPSRDATRQGRWRATWTAHLNGPKHA